MPVSPYVAHLRDPLGVMAAGRWYSQEALADLVQIPAVSPMVSNSEN